MIFNRRLKERVLLLEYENAILADKVRQIEMQLEKPLIIKRDPILIRTDGLDLSYDTLRAKYRHYLKKYSDGL